MATQKNQAQAMREVLNIDEAADYLGIAPDTLYKYAAAGEIPAFKLGNRWRFRLTTINKWMEKKEGESAK